MTRSQIRSVAAVLASLAGGVASAHPFTLSVSSGTASIASTSFGSGAWTVEVVVTAGSPAVFTLSTDTANTVVEKIEVECDADCLMTINETGGGTFSEIRNVLERTTSSPESFEINRVRITGTLGPGSVIAEAINEIEIDGDLTADVTVGPRASSADSDVDLISVGGDIYRAGIFVRFGSIGQIIVDGDIEGEITGSPPRLTPIQARDGIREVEADSIATYDIWANYTEVFAPLETGTLSRLEVRSGLFHSDAVVTAYALTESVSVSSPGILINGDADGVLGFQTAVTCPIEITGDLNGGIWIADGGLDFGTSTQGDITIHGDMGIGSYLWLTNAYTVSGYIRTLVRIGADFGGPTEGLAEILAEGLADGDIGQVIINANLGGGSWTGDVEIASTLLAPVPYYDDTDLVGGVGQVPFHVHELDCIPPDGGTAALNAYEVTLRFYGPVTWDQGILPFIVEYSTDNGTTWTNDNNQWSVLSGKGTRTITLLYSDDSDPSVIPGGRDYRITPVTTGSSELLCDKLLTTSDVPVAFFTYLFSSF